MKSNKAFLPETFFLAVGRGVAELSARMTLHWDFREIGEQAAPKAARIPKRMKPMDIPSQLPLNQRITLNLKTAKQLGMTASPHFLSLAHRVL